MKSIAIALTATLLTAQSAYAGFNWQLFPHQSKVYFSQPSFARDITSMNRAPVKVSSSPNELTPTGYYKNRPAHRSGLLQKKWPSPKDAKQVLVQRWLKAIENNDWETVTSLHCEPERRIRAATTKRGSKTLPGQLLGGYLDIAYRLYEIDFARVTYESVVDEVHQGQRRAVVLTRGSVLLHQNNKRYSKVDFKNIVRTNVPNYIRMYYQNGEWKLCQN